MPVLEFFLGAIEPEQIQTDGPLAIRAVVVDANVLAADVFYYAAHKRSALMDAAQFGAIRLFTSTHLFGLVYSLLPELAYGNRSTLLGEALRVWETEYLRLIYFVDLAGFDSQDPRVIAVPDPEDEPLAKLAALLGPCILLSHDKHLRGLGSAGSDWRPVALASRTAMVPTQAVMASSVPMTLVGEGIGASVRLLRAKPAFRLPAAIFGLGFLGLIAWRLSKVEWREWGRAVGGMVDEAATAIQPLVERYREAKATLEAGTVVAANPTEPVNAVAHMLAVSPRPLGMGEIARALATQPVSIALTTRQIGQVVRSAGCFRPGPRRTWQLGYRAAPRSPLVGD